MVVACIFPGQGTQYVGMGRELSSTRFFDRANKVLDFDLGKLCFDGPEEELERTENTQPAVFVVSYAKFFEHNFLPQLVAGHSLGEWTAACVAGCIEDFETMVRLIRFRGECMAEAARDVDGTMAAVLGYEEGDIRRLCEKVGVYIAAINGPLQFVVSGFDERLGQFEKRLREIKPSIRCGGVVKIRGVKTRF